MRELGKVVAIGVFAQLNILVLRQLAAMVGEGGITHYWYANRLVDLSQGVIAVAIGSALLPNISAAVAEQRWDQVRADIVGALRLTGFLLIPVALGLLAFAEPLTALLFRHGLWTWQDTTVTAHTLRLLVPFMLAVAAINVLKKVFFALEDRTTLLWIGASGIALTAAIGWAVVGSSGVPGLAIALSISTCAQVVAYVALLYRRLGSDLGLRELGSPLARMVVAGAAPAAALAVAARVGQWRSARPPGSTGRSPPSASASVRSSGSV